MSVVLTSDVKEDHDQISSVFAFEQKDRDQEPIYENYYELPRRGSINPFYRIWRLYLKTLLLHRHQDIDYFDFNEKNDDARREL